MTIPVVLFWILVILAIPGVIFAALSCFSLLALLALYYHELREMRKDMR